MTGTHEKLRSLILVTLMVFSVFAGTLAFSGSAVAAHNNAGNEIFDNRGAVAGAESPLDSTVNVTSDTNFTDVRINFSQATNSSGHEFDGNFSLVTDGNVVIRIYDSSGNLEARYQDNATVKAKSESGQTGPEAITVGLTDEVRNDTVPSGGSIYVEFTDDFVNPSAPGLYRNTASGTPSFEFLNDGSSVGGPFQGHLNVSSTAGPGAAAEKEVRNPVQPLQNGTLHYCGQRLRTNGSDTGNSFDPNETVELERQDSNGNWNPVRQTTADETGNVTINTSGLGAGDYRIVGSITPPETSQEEVYFDLICQGLNAEWADSTVQPGDSTTFNISSDERSSYTVHITSPDLSDEVIDDIFQVEDGTPLSGDIRDTTTGVEADITGNERAIDADFSDIPVGNYTFEVGVNDTNASASDYIVVSTAPKDVQLEQDFVEVPRGDLAVYTFSLQNTESGRMELGSDAQGYRVTVTVNDGNEDGTVTVVQNTYLTGRFAADESDAWAAVSSGDSVSANLRTDELDRVVDPAEYGISVRTPGVGETDLGALVVTEPSTGEMNTYISPRDDFAGLSSPAAIAAAKEGGSLTEANEVANGDLVVHQIDATGIYGAIAAQGGDEALIEAGEFESRVNDGTFGLSMVQTNEDINTHPKELELDESGHALTFVPDNQNGSLYVVMRTGTSSNDLHLFREEEVRQDIYRTQGGDNYLDTFSVTGATVPTTGDSVNDTLSVATPQLAFDTVQSGDWAGEIIVWTPDNTDVSGSTNVAPGTDLTIRLRSTDGAGFLKSQPATVAGDGTFSGDFNFTDDQPVMNFTATTQTSLTGSVSNSGILVERPTATVTLNDQTVASADSVQTVTVSSVSMNYGGFLTIHDASLADGDAFGSVAGTSSYLGPGSHSDVEVRLGVKNLQSSQQVFAMPHRDSDDDGTYDFVGSEGADDGPYTEASSGDPVVSAAQITVSTPTPTATPTPTEGGDGPTETDTPTATDTPTSGDGPGFGLVAAVVALLAAALIAVRRD